MGIYEPLFDVFFDRSVQENYKDQQIWYEHLNLIGGTCYIKLQQEAQEEGNLRPGYIQNSVWHKKAIKIYISCQQNIQQPVLQ